MIRPGAQGSQLAPLISTCDRAPIQRPRRWQDRHVGDAASVGLSADHPQFI